MNIERIIISGFKSYKEHTVVDGFDRSFNAITGLNGTGKSNLLDAICFVLGLTSLQKLRADNLRQLIFNSGQSGVTKASVEIVFNNENKAASPPGYQQYDHIHVMRQVTPATGSKYFINDHVVNQQRVHDLFLSVQLNVNNPHFLIMQGRVEEVLDMKPVQIMGLIEEAAGISLFEEKKVSSLKTMERKQKQIDEINRIITEVLAVRLEKLAEEKKEYEQWANMKMEVDRLGRWVVAFDFTECDRRLREGEERRVKAKEDIKALEGEIKSGEQELEAVKEQIKDLSMKKEGADKERFNQLEGEVSKLQKSVTKMETLKEQTAKEIKSDRAKQERLSKQLEKSTQSVEAKKAELESARERQKELEGHVERAQLAVNATEDRISNVNIGIAGENDNTSLADQIQKQKRMIADFDVTQNRIKSSRPHLESQKRQLEHEINETERELANLTRRKQEANDAIAQIDYDIKALKFDDERRQSLIRERDHLFQRLQEVRERIIALERNLGGVDIEFNSPQDFNRDCVHGVVARLFEVSDPAYQTAIEVAGGGRLYNVVVDEFRQALFLTKNHCFKRRGGVTTIPIDKIESKRIPDDLMRRAKNYSRAAHLAMDLLDYNPKYQKVIQYVFGQTVVCDTMDQVSDLAEMLRYRAVSLKGEIRDAAQGTFSGGYRSQSASVIKAIADHRALCAERRELEKRLREVQEELHGLEQRASEYDRLMGNRQLALHELELADDAIKHSKNQEAKDDLERVISELESNEQALEACLSERESAERTLELLEETYRHWENSKNMQLAELEQRLEAEQKELAEAKQARTDHEATVEMLSVDIQEMEKEIAGTEGQLRAIAERITENEQQGVKLEEDLENEIAERNKKTAELDLLKKAMSETNDLLSQAIEKEDKLQKEHNALLLRHKELQDEIERYAANKVAITRKIEELKEEHPWIEQEERFFGVAHTDFDFTLYEPNEAKERLEKMTDTVSQLEGSVNKRVMSMYDRAQSELDSITAKRDTVEAEKEKIFAVIEELEAKKREAIKQTYMKVNGDFNEIVSLMITGATAALRPLEGKEVYDGLELTVSFNEMQKTLHELSGGQKSMIALALVLALAKFKPAPIYILDEVDAALDLNMTQNMGRMLRQSFKNSQFIIVSHKEGMWNNANVIFKTFLRDSVTQIDRTVNTPQ